MSTVTARKQFFDLGEGFDVLQVLGQGGVVKMGLALNGQTVGSAYAVNGLIGAANGGTLITSSIARFTRVDAGTGATLPASAGGNDVIVINAGLNALLVFPTGGDAIEQLAVGTPYPVPAGQTVQFFVANVGIAGVSPGIWHTQVSPSSLQPPAAYNTNAAAAATTLLAANISGGADSVYLNMTGALAAAAALTLPTVAALVAAIPSARSGQSYVLRILSTGGGVGVWTVTTAAGWTLNGSMALAASPSWTDFVLTLTSLTTATLQRVGAGTVA